MLAGERFSDHPRAVSPVIAAFLRAYNDLVDDERRQDLYRFASDAVGTRAPRAVEAARAAVCREWMATLTPPRRRPVAPIGITPGGRRIRQASAAAYTGAMTAKRHAQALLLVERLIALGRDDESPLRDAAPAARDRRATVART